MILENILKYIFFSKQLVIDMELIYLQLSV